MLNKIKNHLSQLVEFYEFFHVNPSLRLRQLEHVLNTTLSIVGLGFLNKKWKFNILTALKVIITIVYILFSAYTVWYFRDQSVFALQVFCCQGVVLPVNSDFFPLRKRFLALVTKYQIRFEFSEYRKITSDDKISSGPAVIRWFWWISLWCKRSIKNAVRRRSQFLSADSLCTKVH